MSATDVNPAPEVTPASTMMMLRESSQGFQVYLMKRSRRSTFMAGTYVFPGGRVDPADTDVTRWLPLLDSDLQQIQARMGHGLAVSEAVGFAVAAVRETFEEAGVLYAHTPDGKPLDLEVALQRRSQHRQGADWFRKMVAAHGCKLRLAEMIPWAHWITPRQMKFRFDTRFFAVSMLPGQTCRPDQRETTEGVWLSPREGLEGNLAGRIPLSPPTLVTLHQLSKFRGLAELLEMAEATRWGPARTPRVIPLVKGAVIILPWDPQISQPDVQIDEQRLPDRLVPAGEDFSRLWNQKGIWRPVAR